MSKQKKPAKDDLVPSEGNLECHVYGAMRCLGWIIPTTESDVEYAEKQLAAETINLPAALKDPCAILESVEGDYPPSAKETVSVDDEVKENLARAAREGGTIRPEIGARMQNDRHAAEQAIS